jgi:hypothetical protein
VDFKKWSKIYFKRWILKSGAKYILKGYNFGSTPLLKSGAKYILKGYNFGSTFFKRWIYIYIWINYIFLPLLLVS